MNRIFLGAVSASAVLIASAPTAQAACIPAPGVVTCSGDITGRQTFDDDGIKLTVETGASIDGNGNDALRARGEDVTVINDGTLTTDDGDGLKVGEGTMVTNSATGQIIGLGADTKGVNGGNRVTVTNRGSISATGEDAEGVNGDDGFTVFNHGSIFATDKAIDLKDNAPVEVFAGGSVTSDNEAIEIDDNGTITVHQGGIVRAVDDAMNPGENVGIDNSGLIESTGTGDGIDLDSGFILNTSTGQIISANSSGIDYDASSRDSEIYNFGLIRGVVGIEVELGVVPNEDGEFDTPNTRNQTVKNFSGGQIIGTGGMAMILGAGKDEVELYRGSYLTGGIDLGDDDDTLIFEGSGGFDSGSFGSVLDGGDGIDTVEFGFRFDLVRSIIDMDGVLTFDFYGLDALDGLQLTNFEFFEFGRSRSRLSLAELQSNHEYEVAPAVPLPAAGWAFLTALAGLFGLRRVRRRAA